MGRIALYVTLLLVALGITVTYTAEVSQELWNAMQSRPDKTCAVLDPVADVITSLAVPIGAQHKNEVIWRPDVPDNFRTVLPLMQAVSVAPCNFSADQEAKVFIRAMRLIERDPLTGTETVVSNVNNFGKQENTRFVGKLFQRLPAWYQGKVITPPRSMISFTDHALIVDLAKAPRFIYHGWSEPQVEAKPGKRYLVEMEVKLTGQARLQMGIDYWRYKGAEDTGWQSDCHNSNHCEGYMSKWFGPSNEWQTVRAPDAWQPMAGNRFSTDV